MVWYVAKACFLEQGYVLQSQIFLKTLYGHQVQKLILSASANQLTNYMKTSEDLLQFVKDDA